MQCAVTIIGCLRRNRSRFYVLLIFLATVLLFSNPVTATETASNVHSPIISASGSGFKDLALPMGGPMIGPVTTNLDDYPGSQVLCYEKLELTFDVETIAENPQWPYDLTPPPGIEAELGVTVNALFTPDNWQTVYTQPAFYYQAFEHEIKSGQDWIYPTDNFTWKVRFSPNQVGSWQYKLTAEDRSGLIETPPQSFSVAPSDDKGFVRVSIKDPRYFELEDGTHFLGLGYNKNYNQVDWLNPTLSNRPEFQVMSHNGIQLLRIWLSQWSIFGSAWNPWTGQQDNYAGYLPETGLVPFGPEQSEFSMMLSYPQDQYFDSCRYLKAELSTPAVKRNTTYLIQVLYSASDLSSRCGTNSDCGLVVRVGGFCGQFGPGEAVTPYAQDTGGQWLTLAGEWHSGDRDFLPQLNLLLENIPDTNGPPVHVFVSHVSIKEDLGNSQYGPNLISKPSTDHHLYFAQRNSFAFDRVLELAEEYDIYLKTVILEKDDRIFKAIDDQGNIVPEDSKWFYGNGRQMTRVRWLQQAWWRYLQARWGYSPHIHSWELINEGDPYDDNHYALTDELGKTMHCRAFGVPVGSGDGEECSYGHPNHHLITTSFWHSFPGEQFWGNPLYPNVDYADVHAYISTGWQNDASHENDAAKFHLDYSADIRSNIDWYSTENGMPTKPIIRGETGIDTLSQQEEQPDLASDSQGIWLHNFLWASLDAGALAELYWWEDNIKNQPGPDGQSGLHEIYNSFYTFLSSIRLNSGRYQDAAVTVSSPDLRVVGQKDVTSKRAHLWIQNRGHTWRNVVDGVPISPVSGTITLSGFQGGQNYTAQWWDTYHTPEALRLMSTEVITAQANGDIILTISDMIDDTAVSISPSMSALIYLPVILKR
jgi:hypothetical protein